MKMAKTVLGYLLILSFYLGRFLAPHLRSLLPSLKLSKEKKKEKKEKILLRVIQKFRKEKYYTVKIIVHV